MAEILNRLVLKATPETWEAIIKSLPAKTGSLTIKEMNRRRAERQIRESRAESSG
jgi:hypothetical protein